MTDNNGNNYNKARGYKSSLRRSKIAGILCLIVIAVMLFLISPVFDVEKIVVEGNSINDDAKILGVANIEKGTNIFALDVAGIKSSVMKLEYVASVYVERSLPSTVTIHVSEKDICAYIPIGDKKAAPKPAMPPAENESDSSADSDATVSESVSYDLWDKYVCIDEKGRIIAFADALSDPAPVITGIEISDSEKGQYIKIKDESHAKTISDLICRMLAEMKKQGVIVHISEIDLSELNNIRLMLNTDTLVNMGEDGDEDGDNIEYKIAFLEAIIDQPRQKGGVIELSDTDNVTERMSR
ncbi:MAG: FtsQ-type POTRA domain-containing protein [Clostridia bacterium]|nr:FtsQ-type POTRA domain-containing protein [Clostridia bacterium]